MTGMKVPTEQLKNFRNDIQKKYPFEKGIYHQCIPNPELPGQYITVQFITRATSKVEGGMVGSNNSYQNYNLAMPGEDSDKEDAFSADGDNSDEIKENSLDDNDLSKNLTLFDQRRLEEKIDAEKGSRASDFARLVK